MHATDVQRKQRCTPCNNLVAGNLHLSWISLTDFMPQTHLCTCVFVFWPKAKTNPRGCFFLQAVSTELRGKKPTVQKWRKEIFDGPLLRIFPLKPESTCLVDTLLGVRLFIREGQMRQFGEGWFECCTECLVFAKKDSCTDIQMKAAAFFSGQYGTASVQTGLDYNLRLSWRVVMCYFFDFLESQSWSKKERKLPAVIGQ